MIGDAIERGVRKGLKPFIAEVKRTIAEKDERIAELEQENRLLRETLLGANNCLLDVVAYLTGQSDLLDRLAEQLRQSALGLNAPKEEKQ